MGWSIRAVRTRGKQWPVVAVAVLLVAGAAGCGSSGKRAVPPPPSTNAVTTTTAPAGVQTSGVRTVLSPIGLHVRAGPSLTARVLGSAAQGTVLRVLSHTERSGGWYEVKGATVTGWISGDPSLSATGEFRSYASASFGALYPATWTAAPARPASVAFRSRANPDDFLVTPAAAVTRLPKGRPGYGRLKSEQVVVCGVTSNVVTFQRAASTSATSQTAAAGGAPPYLALVLLTLDAHHALGVYANLSDLGQPLQSFRQFLDSVTFPQRECVG
jgi:Bacterial SH3 domain